MAMSHETCTHPRTPAGRAACRKAGGPGAVRCTCNDYPEDGSVLIHSHTCPMKAVSVAKNGPSLAEVINASAKTPGPKSRVAKMARTTTRKVNLADMPGVFRTVVKWAEDHGCDVTTSTIREQNMVHVSGTPGTLTLTWSPVTPEGVHAVSFRPHGTSVTSRVATVNDGLAKLKG